MKTSELTGAALDWAVHVALHGACEGYAEYEYSTDWSQGGPIIEREKLDLEWRSISGCRAKYEWLDEPFYEGIGPTPLIAAMRCYVASKLGDDVDVPEELL